MFFFVDTNICYLKLKAQERTITNQLKKFYFTVILKKKFLEIEYSHPYFSSLQLAIWDLDHLERTVHLADNIWSFERINNQNIKHFSLFDSPFKYKHVVEKGKWDVHSESLIKFALGNFDYGTRARINYSIKKRFLNYLKKQVYFPLFGYSYLKLKSILKILFRAD